MQKRMKLITNSCGKRIDIQDSPLYLQFLHHQKNILFLRSSVLGYFTILFCFVQMQRIIPPCKFWCLYVVFIEMNRQNSLIFGHFKQLPICQKSIHSVDVKYLNVLLMYFEQSLALSLTAWSRMLILHVTIMLLSCYRHITIQFLSFSCKFQRVMTCYLQFL